MYQKCRTWVMVVLLSAPVPTAAQTIPRFAVFPAMASGHTPLPLLRQVDSALERVVSRVAGAEVVMGADLERLLRLSPAAAIRACEQDPSCLSRLGRRARVGEVLTVLVRAHDDGIRLIFIAVGVDSRRLLRTVSVRIDDVSDTDSAVGARLPQILGVSHAQLSQALEPPVEEELAMPELAMPGLEPAPTLAPLPGTLDQHGPTSQRQSEWMWYSGLGLAAASAATFAASSYFALRYRAKASKLHADRSKKEIPQVRAVDLRDEANEARSLSMVLALVGGGLLVAGGGFFFVDLLSQSEARVTVTWVGERAEAGLWLLW